MADDDELRELARRYLDLWERQVAESATDPHAARAMAQWQAMVNGSSAARQEQESPLGPVAREGGDAGE